MTTFLAPAAPAHLASSAVPSFGIVIAAYNAAPTVAEAIESALAQTLAPAEIVICDDGSTDDIAGAVRPFRSQITLIQTQNRGEMAAKNTAVNATRADWVVILDADDVFAPTRLERIGALAAVRPDLDVITTDAVLERDGVPLRSCYAAGNVFETEDQALRLLRRNFVFGLAAVRRSALLDAGMFDESIRRTGDWEMWIRMALRGSLIGCVAEPLATYRIRDDSLSADQELLLRGRLETLERVLRYPALTTEQAAVAADSLAAQRRQLGLFRARKSLLARRPDARRRLLAVAFGLETYDLASRIKAFVAAVAPRSAARRLERAGPQSAAFRTQDG